MWHFVESIVQASVQRPFALAVAVAAVQLLLIAMLAEWLTRTLLKGDARMTHRVWCGAAAIALLTLPLHGAGYMWGIPLPVDRADSPVGLDGAIAIVDSQPPQRYDAPSDLLTFDAEPLPEASHSADAAAAYEVVAAPVESSVLARSKPMSNDALHLNASGLAGYAAFGYAAGLLWCLGRILYSYILLRSAVARSPALGAAVAGEAREVAVRLQLKRLPDLRLSPTTHSPYVFGCFSPTIVLPGEFESWERDERLAVLAHELSHVRRGDFAWSLLAQIAVAAYWLHPAVWWIRRRLTQSRELAADDFAVTGVMDRRRYAAGLVRVLERLSNIPPCRPIHSSLAVTMSAFGDVHDRVRQVLAGSLAARPQTRWLCRISILAAVVLVAASSVKFREAAAQPAVDKSVEEASPKSPHTAGSSPSKDTPSIDFVDQPPGPDSHDLIHKVETAEVFVADASREAIEFNFGGIVLDKEGQPVPEATVVLVESVFLTQIATTPTVANTLEDKPFGRIASVYAKVKTDTQGRYDIHGVRSKPVIEAARANWQGSIIAVHPRHGVQWDSLNSKNINQVERQPLRLSPTTSIQGTYRTPDGEPIANAVVVLQSLKRADDKIFNSVLWLETTDVQPTAVTDSRGVFRFSDLPETCSAFVHFKRGAWGEQWTSIKTSNFEKDLTTFAEQEQPVPSPAAVTAQKDFVIHGMIRGDDGQPAEGMHVGIDGLIKAGISTAAGNYQLPLHRQNLDRILKRNEMLAVRVHSGKAVTYLPTQAIIERSALSGDSLTLDFAVRRGVRVSGRAVDSEGQPAEGIAIVAMDENKQLLSPSFTKEDGSFELYVAQESVEVFVASQQGGYALPSWTDLWRATLRPPEAQANPRLPNPLPPALLRIPIDVSDEKPLLLEPIVVKRQMPVEVVVSLADGGAARDAKVVLKDYGPPQPSNVRSFRFLQPASEEILTNSLGRALLEPTQMLTDTAIVAVEYTAADGITYSEEIPLSTRKEDVISVVLKKGPLLRGRILLNGEPVAGAEVSIDESQAMLDANGNRTGGSTSRPVVTAVTDVSGTYSASVSASKNYSVRLKSLPGVGPLQLWFSYSATERDGDDLVVRDMNVESHAGEIAGTVVDSDGKPLSEVQVNIRSSMNSNPGLWLGHRESSQMRTDADGRFSLKNVPPGDHQLQIFAGHGERRINAVQVAKAGDSDVRIQLHFRPARGLQRLTPKSVEKLPSE